MAVYKTEQYGSDAHTESRETTLVASVNSQQPRVSRVANAIKVDGQLNSSITTIRLELFKLEDCRAEFICEVIAVDAKGRELVRTSHLLQQPSSPALDTAGEEGWTPAVAMHLVNLVQDLSTNMELTRNTLEDYRNRLSGVENRVVAFQKDVTSSILNLEKGVSDNSRILENRLEDKMERLEDKFSHFEDISTSTDVQILNKINEKHDIDTSFANKIESFEEKLEKQIGFLSKEQFSQLYFNVSTIGNNLALLTTSMQTSVQDNARAIKQKVNRHELRLNENLRESLSQLIKNSTGFLVSNIDDQFGGLKDRMEERFTELTSKLNENAIEIKSSFVETVNGMNITNADEVASAMTDILTPKTCKRGMISLLTQTSYPYPVIKPRTSDSLTVPYLCDTVTDGGGWIIIQRRTTGNVDFYRNWADYKKGFGTLDDDFWLGNDNIHAVTSSGQYDLRIDMRYKGKFKYAHYDSFALADEHEKYTISLGLYDGTAGDALVSHRNKPFSTFDRDNDEWNGNCAASYLGAWWYENCHASNLNGKWGEGSYKGLRWSTFSNKDSVSFSEMKIRRM